MAFNPFWAGNPAGLGQQTMAGQIIVAGANRTRTPARKRRKSAKRAAAPAARRRRGSKRPARLVKGSAAAKRYMASIRRKRRK